MAQPVRTPKAGPPQRAVCPECDRDVRVVLEVGADGIERSVLLDPEVVLGAVYPGGTRLQPFRRSHKENCLRYQYEAEQKKKRDRWQRQMGGGRPLRRR